MLPGTLDVASKVVLSSSFVGTITFGVTKSLIIPHIAPRTTYAKAYHTTYQQWNPNMFL
jgi:hypothetical protein